MKRRYLALTCALSLACVLTGCWGGDRDDTTPHSTSPVAPTESVAPSHSAAPTETAGTEPSVSPTDNYHADGEGQVVETNPIGGTLRVRVGTQSMAPKYYKSSECTYIRGGKRPPKQPDATDAGDSDD